MTLVKEVPDVQAQIVECIDRALQQLGQSVAHVVYFHLDKEFGIRKEEVPNQPEALSKALHAIFGQGAKLIECIIIREIQEKLKLDLDPEAGITNAMEVIKRESHMPRPK